ncbi:carotenoid oxygenase family protein [Shewanella sp. SR43-8]|uniref:carotenoid oxygenase family protein n=1 Tax=Shewanella sp. SR43-8 TaxID=2760938 RepID=UPI0015FF8473|nr:carotenoid oxygenase family protein [Shewanella sp. SR43-8]MBB1321156.1 carotenoid oxygenase family protein [Shewanella sp. SR43-8]|tara:strand:- start:1499 stop:3016 length:1518 start_codon:yes stop_codon:yes gene_type:complete
MQRRQFLKSMAIVGASSALPASATLLTAPVAPAMVNVKQLFNDALAVHPELIGFANVERNFEPQTLSLEGRIPADLHGVFYRNGPAKHERGAIRYQHAFEGDGMLQRFEIKNQNIVHRGQFINTPKFSQEQQAQQFVYSGPETKIAHALPVVTPDTVNTANTNIIAVGDDLWALWEAGSPTKIDRDSMQFQQQVHLGAESKYANTLQGLPFSAHPKVDPSGDIWNFGLHPSGNIVLYHLASNGNVKNAGVINTQYRGAMLHDFLITDKHLLIILPSLFTDKSIEGHFEQIKYNTDIPMRVLVISKQSLTVIKHYELPAGFVFHYGNAWEEINGTIHFDASLYPDVNVLHKLSNVMQGKIEQASTKAKTALITLHTEGHYSMQIMPGTSEFPRVCDHVVGLKNHYLYHLSAKTNSLWSDTLSSLNTDTGAEQHYHFGEDYLVEEHISVCQKAIENTGYLIGTALHVPTKRTCLNIFAVNDLSSGPIARAWLPYHLPLGFHGNFMPS